MRCASCSASWRVAPPLELDVRSDVVAVAESPAPEDHELFESPPAKPPAVELPKAFRARAETEKRTREAAVQGVIWAGMGAAFAMLIGAGVVFRSDVVSFWPKAASAYASVGLAVNPVGVAIEDVRFQHALEDGHPALVVTGVLRNIRPRSVSVPPLQIVLHDKQGSALLTRTAVTEDAELGPGQSRSFAVSLIDPPMFAADLDLTFAPGVAPKLRSRPAQEAAPARAEPSPALPRAMMVGPAIPEAKPLPPGSPYALAPAG